MAEEQGKTDPDGLRTNILPVLYCKIIVDSTVVGISVSQIENLHICGSKFFSRFRDKDD